MTATHFEIGDRVYAPDIRRAGTVIEWQRREAYGDLIPASYAYRVHFDDGFVSTDEDDWFEAFIPQRQLQGEGAFKSGSYPLCPTCVGRGKTIRMIGWECPTCHKRYPVTPVSQWVSPEELAACGHVFGALTSVTNDELCAACRGQGHIVPHAR